MTRSSSPRACALPAPPSTSRSTFPPIAVVFNLQGVSGKGKTLNMDAETIAKIFDGKITKWNDDAIKKQNPKVDLPDLDITWCTVPTSPAPPRTS